MATAKKRPETLPAKVCDKSIRSVHAVVEANRPLVLFSSSKTTRR
jgi:hypothetical protein